MTSFLMEFMFSKQTNPKIKAYRIQLVWSDVVIVNFANPQKETRSFPNFQFPSMQKNDLRKFDEYLLYIYENRVEFQINLSRIFLQFLFMSK